MNDHIQLCQHFLWNFSWGSFWGTQFSDRRRQAGYDFERIKAIGWCRRTKMSAWLPATSWFSSLSHLLFRLFIFHLNPLDMNILLENNCLLDWKIPDTSQISIPDIPGSLLHWNPGVSGTGVPVVRVLRPLSPRYRAHRLHRLHGGLLRNG